MKKKIVDEVNMVGPSEPTETMEEVESSVFDMNIKDLDLPHRIII